MVGGGIKTIPMWQHACHVAEFPVCDASIARGDECFTTRKFKQIQSDCSRADNCALRGAAAWRISPANVVIATSMMP
jgi:hypothetical protein